MIDKKQKNFVISVLRRSTFKWKPRSNAKKAARIKIGKYKNGKDRYGYRCNICKKGFMEKDTVMDHIEPVVKVTGFDTLDEYIARMIPYEDGWQVCCSQCHDEKTAKETEQRVKHRKKKKLDKSKK